MLKNYFTIAIRNLIKNKAYSLINILGLSIGMACCIFIGLFLHYELTWDSFWPNADRIYRIVQTESEPNERFTPGTELTQAILEAFPEIEDAVRLHHWHVWSQRGEVGQDKRICLVDPRVFDFFGFELLQGDAEVALREPFSAVITDRMARQYFGDEDPMGKTFEVTKSDAAGFYTVTGVVKHLSHTTLPRFDFLTTRLNAFTQPLWMRKVPPYIRLKAGVSFPELEPRLSAFITNHLHQDAVYQLQPLTRVYLHSDSDFYPDKWSRNFVYFSQLALVAVFILLLACINFINLSTARSTQRAREVGIRKVVGAYRWQLIRQFLGESILISVIAVGLAFGLAKIAKPEFSNLLMRGVSLDQLWIWGSACLGSVLIGVLAGCYPAFFLSKFEPALVLKGSDLSGRKAGFRQGLVVFQFVVSIFLIVCTSIVFQQLHFFRNKPLGYDKEHLISVPVFREGWETNEAHPERRLSEKYQAVKEAFLTHPNVLKAAAARSYPSYGGGNPVRAQKNPGVITRAAITQVDEGFLDLYGLKLVAGQNFIGTKPETVVEKSLIINETTAKQLGLENPIGEFIESVNGTPVGTVVGVVKDFHHQSLRHPISSLILKNDRSLFWHLTLKVRSENMPETMAFLEEKWYQFCKIRKFRYFFVDEGIDRQYRTEERHADILTVSAMLAIFVACLGLLGLATFTAERRTKEIGVRKVLGATTRDIVILLSQTFTKPVLLANIIAWPIAYVLMQRWLANFAYRITLGIDVFLLGGLIAFLIACLTVGYQALKAARSNPVDALRCE